MTHALGFDIGGTKIAVGLYDSDGRLCAKQSAETPQSYDAFIAKCAELYAALNPPDNCTVGVGIAGPIDHERGCIAASSNLPFLTDKPLRQALSETLGHPVALAGDGPCVGLAEAREGAGRGHALVFSLILGTGVGGALFHNGQLLSGPNGLTGEVGHLPMPAAKEAWQTATACVCGLDNCIEKVISGGGLARLYKYVSGQEGTAVDVAARAKAGDALALKTLDLYYENVARALMVVLHSFDPHIIVVSGGLCALDGLYTEVPKRWGTYCLAKKPKTLLVRSHFGNEAGLRGAALFGCGMM